MGKSRMHRCCSKWICLGCEYANKNREREQGLEYKCLFCREPVPKTDEEHEKNLMERVKANDPVGLFQMGSVCDDKGDYEGAIQYWTKAAELGNVEAHFNLSQLYMMGEGVEKDKKKAVHHLEEAAIGGHPGARYNLGCHEGYAERDDRATRHFIIAAKLGFDLALDAVKKGFTNGILRKEDFEAALRGHQAAVDATKSEQREEAEKAREGDRFDIK
jgi:TPR repeat protein